MVTKGVEYCYDEEGNLSRKTEADGSVWEYSYYGNGMLRKVVRPDNSAVIFKYDALGRRIEKCITKAGSEKIVSFTEKKAAVKESKWETIGGVRIRKPDTEPVKPYVAKGETSSIYAGEASLTVKKVIRFQGQYEDEEIGLYYNRFPYYDPQTGQYTQQDPIGLAGGNPTLYG